MKIYVGYIAREDNEPICCGLDKKKIEEFLENDFYYITHWVEEFILPKDDFIEF